MSAQELDLAKLEPWLREKVPPFEGALSADKFAGGQSNPTFKLTAGAQHYVLRRKPPGELLASAHAVDREFRVLDALAQTDVPVPKVVALCEDDRLIGSMFYVMEHLEGRIFWDPTVPEVGDADRAAIYDEMNRVLAALRRVDVDAVGNFSTEENSGNDGGRKPDQDTVESLVTDLGEKFHLYNGNTPDKFTLVHIDYRLDNMMFGGPYPITVVDWSPSIGTGGADAAYFMAWQFPRQGGIVGLEGVKRSPLMIPSDEAYIEAYCQRTGRASIDHWPFYMAFCFFRIAAILQGIKKRALIGTASSAEADSRAVMVGPLAALGAGYIKQSA